MVSHCKRGSNWGPMQGYILIVLTWSSLPCWSIFQQLVAYTGEIIECVHVSKEFKELICTGTLENTIQMAFRTRQMA